MSGYYPEGVTGNEYEIAGPDAEWDDTREVMCDNSDCPMVDKEVEVDVEMAGYRETQWGRWTCPTCGKEQEFTEYV